MTAEEITTSIEKIIVTIGNTIPLELFLFPTLLLEEVVPFIPTTLVVLTTGSIAHTQQHGLLYLIWLASLGATAKTIGSLCVYIIADKLEDVVTHKWGRYLGLSHKQIEQIGEKFHRSWKDDIIILVLRSLPVFPTTLLSATCGVIKINKRTFIQSTFLGAFIKTYVFLYLGYQGITKLDTLLSLSYSQKHIVSIGVVALIAVLILSFALYARRTNVFAKFGTKKEK